MPAPVPQGIADTLEAAIDAVDRADSLSLDVLRYGGPAENAVDPAVELAQRCRQRPLDIPEQDQAGLIGVIHCPVHVGFVEHYVFAVAPSIGLAIDMDAAVVGVWRGQTEVVAQRAGEGGAVRIEVAVGRQQSEHCSFYRRDPGE